MKDDSWPSWAQVRLVRNGVTLYGNYSAGDLALIPHEGGWRLVEYVDDFCSIVAWGDIQMPAPAGTRVAPKFSLTKDAGKYRGRWWPSIEAAAEEMKGCDITRQSIAQPA